MRARRLLGDAAYAVGLLVIGLTAARFLGLPVAAAVVAGHSMEPSIRFGDLALLVRVDDPRGLSPGDVVLWCTAPRSCVLHRLLELRDSVAITKGDANPLPDPPVPISAVKYRAVLVVPREAWAAPLAAYAASEAYRLARESLEGRPARLETLLTGVLLIYGTVLFLAPVVAPTPPGPRDPFQHLRPAAYLVEADMGLDGSVAAVYRLANVEAFEPLECGASIGGLSAACVAEATFFNGTRAVLRVTLPGWLLTEAYHQGSTGLRVDTEVGLGGPARLEARLTRSIAWETPRVEKGPGCSLVVENPNPGVSLNITLRLRLYNITLGPGGSHQVVAVGEQSMTVEAGPGETLVELPRWDRVAVKALVPAPGGGVKEQVLALDCRR